MLMGQIYFHVDISSPTMWLRCMRGLHDSFVHQKIMVSVLEFNMAQK